jgi:Recombination endonuclease VII
MRGGLRGATLINATKTHCAHGHPYTPENTYLRKDAKGRMCRECRRLRLPHKNKPAHDRNVKLKWKYGLTEQAFNAMLASQGGRCVICRIELTLTPRQRNTAHVDHDHKTGRVRGVLCMLCNNALGSLHDDPERALRAAEYLGGRVCRQCNREAQGATL